MRLLFICTGNTCRSPMAEGLFRRLASEEGLDAEVKSAGIAAVPGAAFARNAVTVLKERQAQFQGNSTAFTPDLLSWADIVFVMTSGHKRALLSRSPEYVDKIHLLRQYIEHDQEADDQPFTGDYDIGDPVGGTLEDYRRCADELESLLRRLVARLKDETSN